MRALGIAALVMMAGVGSLVGVRLLQLAGRTRQLPELSLGAGLVLITLGAPASALGRAPSLIETTAGELIFAVGLALCMAGLACFYVFTWRAFRSDSAWALAVVLLASGLLGAEWLGMMHASAQGSTMAEMLPHTRPWGIAITCMPAAAFLWTAFEAGSYHLRLRRRQRIGLAEPVVANRFFLWSVSGFAAALLCGAVVGSMLAGLAPLRHPLPLCVIGTASLVVSIVWGLTFLPPPRYVAWIEGRSAEST